MQTIDRTYIARIVILILIPLAFGLSCTEVSAPVMEEPKEIMPLGVGNKWTYLSGTFSIPDTTVLEITRQILVTIDSVTYQGSAYKYYVQGAAKPDFEWLYWNGDDGLYRLGGVSSQDSFYVKRLAFKYPAEIGESWFYSNLAYSRVDEQFYTRDTLNIFLIAKEEEFETPAGKFYCYVYKYSRKPADDVFEHWDYYDYFSPGIGLVAFTIRGQSDGRLIDQSVLYDYQIAK